MSPTSHVFFLLRAREFRNAIVVRGLVVWAGLRLLSWVAPTPALNPVGQLLLIAIVALVVGMEANRRGERLFLANLGIPFRTVVSSALLVPAILEVVFF
jgi:hypothetical protein